MNTNTQFQTYLKDCDCSNEGILIYGGLPHCRWCTTAYAKGGQINYSEERFKSSHASTLSEGGEWEIVDYKNKISGNIYSADGFASNPMKADPFNIYSINSVRRKSDNEVFGIGDEDNNYGKIVGFEIKRIIPSGNDQMFFTYEKDNAPFSTKTFGEANICHLKKKAPLETKPVLFTTEDGKKIRIDSEFWWVGRKTFLIGVSVAHKFTVYAKAYFESYITFSTEEAAKAFVLENKPVLSLKDIENCTAYQDLSGFKWGFINQDSITQLAKQRIGGDKI